MSLRTRHRNANSAGCFRACAQRVVSYAMLRLFLALGMLLPWAVAGGQSVAFAELTIPGIAGAHVTSMAVDEHGALWLGTDKGLHRFDGAATEHYVSDPSNPSSLPDDLVRDVRMDVGGILWVSTVSGAWHIDTRTGDHGIGRFVTPDGVHGNVECLATASDGEGGVWAFCNRSGVFLRAAGDSLFRRRSDASVEGAAGGVMAADGGLWFSDRGSIKHLDPSSGNITSYPVQLNGQHPPPKTLLLGLKADTDDPAMLWCGSWGMGLLRFDTRTHRWSAPAIAKLPLSDLWNVVHAHAPMGGGRCYVAMDDRLWMVDAAHMVPEPMTASVGPERSVRAVFADGDRYFIGALGEVWTTTSPRAAIDPMPGALARLNTHIAPDTGGDGYWQVRYYFDRGLSRIGADGEERYRVPLPPSDRPYEPFIVHQGRDGTVRLGTTFGLLRHVPGTRTLDVEPVVLGTTPHARPYVHSLLEDETGSFWLALGKDGVVRLSADGEIELHVPLSAIAWGAWNGITDVRPHDATHLLISCAGRGLALLEKQTGTRDNDRRPDAPGLRLQGDEQCAGAGGHKRAYPTQEPWSRTHPEEPFG
jgi:hypothetical protein